jgi:hypothetical protein
VPSSLPDRADEVDRMTACYTFQLHAMSDLSLECVSKRESANHG